LDRVLSGKEPLVSFYAGGENEMSVAIKKPESPQGVPQIHIQVGRQVVNDASRQTSVTINQMTDQIAREIAREVEKKQP